MSNHVMSSISRRIRATARFFGGLTIDRPCAAATITVSFLLCFGGATAQAQDAAIDGRLSVISVKGAGCPSTDRTQRTQLLVWNDRQDSSPIGVVLIGDELVMSIEGRPDRRLQLRDRLARESDAKANWLEFDRWPNPQRARLAFQFFRHDCQVLEAELAPASTLALSSASQDQSIQLLAAIDLLARALEAGRAGDSKPGLANARSLRETLRSRLGPHHAVALEALWLDMATAQNTGKFEVADDIARELRQALAAIYGENSLSVAQLRGSIAYTHWIAGRREQAVAENGAAIAAVAAITSKSGGLYFGMLSRQAAYLLRSGRQREAIEIAAEAEAGARAALGATSIERINAAGELAAALIDGGRVAEARPLLAEVLPAAKTLLGDEHPAYLRLLNNYVNMAEEQSLYEEAAPAVQFILQLRERRLGPDHPDTVSAQVNHASNLSHRRRFKEAEEVLLSAYQRASAANLQAPMLTIELNLSQLTLQSGDLQRADAYIAAASARARAIFGERHVRYIKTLIARAEWLRRSGLSAQALAQVQLALQYLAEQRRPSVLDEMYARIELASVQLALEQRDEAAATLESIVRLSETQRTEARADTGGRRALLGRWIPQYRRLAALEVDGGRTERAFELAELIKGRSLLDRLSEQDAQLAAGLDASDRHALQAAADRVVRLEQRRDAAAPGSAEAADTAVALSEARAQYADELASIGRKVPRYTELTTPRIVSATTARGLLTDGELAVSFIWLRERVLVFGLTRQALQSASVPLTARDRMAISAIARVGADPTAEGDTVWELPDGSRSASAARPAADARAVPTSQLAAEVGALLFNPIKSMFQGNRRLLVSPDGPLATVPFEVLHVDSGPIIDRFELRYASSLSVHAKVLERPLARHSSRPPRPILAVGAPTFDGAGESPARSASAGAFRSAGTQWAPLPGARREIDALVKAFPSTRVLVGDDATESELQRLDRRGELTGFRQIHFATHAYYSSSRPEMSAIVLRQPGTPAADGYLTMAEVLGYRLDSELTVLSACETAKGQVIDGDGLVGFAYALLLAGNRNMIAAMWRVPDESAAALMRHFFAGLKTGKSHARALADAKRALRSNPRFRDPLHWAAFVLYGD